MISPSPFRTAIFPLPGAVLFPNTLLPLRVFEPRYVDLMRDVLAGHAPLAIAHLRPGYEDDYYGRPEVYSFATLTRVIEASEHANGNYDLVVRGVERLRIEEELPAKRSYREVLASIVNGGSTARERDIGALKQQVVSLCTHLAVHMDEAGGLLMQLVQSIHEAGPLADALASALVGDPQYRQNMLEMIDVYDRLDVISDLLSGELARLSSSSSPPGAMN